MVVGRYSILRFLDGADLAIEFRLEKVGRQVTQIHSSARDSIATRRWIVHVLLIIGFLASVISAIFLSRKYLGHSGVTDHAIVGLIVLGLVMVHLAQRRRTVKRLLTRLMHRNGTDIASRRAESDLILWLLTLNAVVSGAADFLVGHQIILPIPGPYVFQKWHELSALVLLVYVIVHVARRRSRLRTSHIR
jgi:hypothetical protein